MMNGFKSRDLSTLSQVQAAERKTAVMRLQNRLQQSFAKKLKPGQGLIGP
jgi:hypothetical protein